MKILLRCNGQLRYLIQTLSFARQLDAKGYQVYVETDPKWHSIFKLCPYAVAIHQGLQPPRGFKFDRILTLELNSFHVYDFRRAKLKWWDFFASRYPELGSLVWSNPFDLSLIPPCHAQMPCVYGLVRSKDEEEGAKYFRLIPEYKTLMFWGLYGEYHKIMDLPQLASLVFNVKELIAPNCGLTLMADALRESYDHIADPNDQSDFKSAKQRRHKL